MKGKTVLITGAASGIGKAAARRFAQVGSKVVISDIDQDKLEEVAEELMEMGAEVLSIRCDVSDAEGVKELISKSRDHFGGLHAAVNNAGIEGKQGFTADYEIEDWDRVMNVNLRGQWLCMKYELPELLKTRGAIVNVSSILGKVGFAGAAAYTAAKHGLIGLTEAAALEYAPEGVRVNAVCPGFIETPMLERAGITTDEDTKHGIEQKHPLGRLGTSEEIAEAIYWLCSDASSFVTGHSLLVDGGYVAQ